MAPGIVWRWQSQASPVSDPSSAITWDSRHLWHSDKTDLVRTWAQLERQPVASSCCDPFSLYWQLNIYSEDHAIVIYVHYNDCRKRNTNLSGYFSNLTMLTHSNMDMGCIGPHPHTKQRKKYIFFFFLTILQFKFCWLMLFCCYLMCVMRHCTPVKKWISSFTAYEVFHCDLSINNTISQLEIFFIQINHDHCIFLAKIHNVEIIKSFCLTYTAFDNQVSVTQKMKWWIARLSWRFAYQPY